MITSLSPRPPREGGSRGSEDLNLFVWHFYFTQETKWENFYLINSLLSCSLLIFLLIQDLASAYDIEANGEYVLAKPENEEVGFYQATTGTIKAGKAYIELTGNTGSLVKALYFAEESETAIGSIQNSKFEIQNGEVYNLAGQKLSKLQKGVNIVSGRKVLY